MSWSRYSVVHETTYEYDDIVSASYSLLHLLPREDAGQRCVSSSIDVVPEPEDRSERLDFFGNRVEYVALAEGHRSLTVRASSVVEVGPRAGLSLFGQAPWEEVRDRAFGDVEAVQFVLDSPRIRASDVFAKYAAASFPAGASVLEGAVSLASRIFRDFEFDANGTDVHTPVEESFAGRRGVCQDFAHIGIACLRSLGLPARYVSGYLETDPPPGQEKLVGADVSHAWFSVLIPGAGWLDVDPTNDQLVNQRYVVCAVGRDYGDVAPVTGVIYTRSTMQKLSVMVDVAAR